MNGPDHNSSEATYRIVIQGEIGEAALRGLRGLAPMTWVQEGRSQNTVLTVQVRDQASLRGLLNQLWDLNLTLIDIRRLLGNETREDDHGG